jgi:ABC-2 type transport system permease protein
MRRAWLVAKQEYLNRVRQRSFLLGTLSILLLIVVVSVISGFIATGGRDTRPLGYIDLSGVLQGQSAPAADGPEIRPFADEAAARAALEAGEIQAFYLLPQDYPSRHEVTLFYGANKPGIPAQRSFDRFVRAVLTAGTSPEVRQRLTQGSHLVLRSLDGRRQIDSSNFVDALLPFLAGLLFVIATMSSSGYLLQALTAEKENRTSEVMMTTMTPMQLVGGKSAGLMAVSLTQLAIWLAVALVGILVASRYVPELRGLRVSGELALVVVLYFLPSYILIAGMMTAIGAIMPDQQQGQQIAGMLNLLFFIPYFLAVIFFSSPNSPLAVALTLFPTTAFTAITVRWGMTAIPTWQLVASWMILAVAAAFSVMIAAQLFRIGMLAYGQRLSLSSIRAAFSGILTPVLPARPTARGAGAGHDS